MQVLKKQLRKHGKPLEQLCNRMVEAQSKEHRQPSDGGKPFKLSRQHCGGLLLPECCPPEYQMLKCRNFTIALKERDNCFMQDGHIVIARNIAHMGGSNEPCIIGQEFLVKEDLYPAPFESSRLGIFIVARLSTPKPWPLRNVRKMVKLPWDSKFVALPELHTMAYAIVEFLRLKQVEVVPAHCAWPDQAKGDKIIVMVKKAVPPDASWRRFAVVPTKAAPRKVPAVPADFPQGLFTAASKEGSSSAGRQSSSVPDDLGNFAPEICVQGSSHSQAPSDSSENGSILDTDIRSLEESRSPVEGLQASELQDPQDQAFKQHVLRLLNIMRFTLQQHGEMLNKLCAILPVHAVIAHPSLVEQAFNTLPDLLAFEKELDEEKALRLVHELKQLGGKTASKATKRMLTYLLTDELAAQFSWIGRKGKLNFSVLKTATAITDAAKKLPGGKDAIEDAIKSWLRHAPERAKGQRCKAPEAHQNEESD
ncbi:uncharacterized protein LOC115308822 [Ixodes scapularis]|uniref:uncharacterized protein LOC115308822 n=1 Tax=Ixodes scapularis TaxID=6945 RepID=UPI001C38747C|nr:uncharacterized protein LOC115308822 [Ixodes scapularis]